MIKKYPFLLSVFVLFFSCDRLQENESNIWVGSEIYYHGNITYLFGFNRSVLNFNNLKSYHVGLMKYNDSIHIKDSINIKGFVWKFKSKIKDRLIYEFDKDTNYTMTFMRIKKADSYLSFDKVLSKKWYRTLVKENESFVIDENYDFTYPQLTIDRHYFLDQNPIYFEREFYKIDTLSISNNHFLILKQNKTFFIDQITHYDNSNLTLYNYNSLYGSERKFTDIPLEKKETSFKDAQNFELCKSGEIAQYYYNDIGVSNSRNRLEMFSYFLKHYDYSSDSAENGYIRFRFIVNCKGEIGRFSLQEMDRDYNKKRFPLEITQQLFVLISQMDGWLPKKWSHNNWIDYYFNIGFKIKNGQIEEILP